MKSHTEHLTFNLPARMAFLNITLQVEEIVRKSGVHDKTASIEQEDRLICKGGLGMVTDGVSL